MDEDLQESEESEEAEMLESKERATIYLLYLGSRWSETRKRRYYVYHEIALADNDGRKFLLLSEDERWYSTRIHEYGLAGSVCQFEVSVTEPGHVYGKGKNVATLKNDDQRSLLQALSIAAEQQQRIYKASSKEANQDLIGDNLSDLKRYMLRMKPGERRAFVAYIVHYLLS